MLAQDQAGKVFSIGTELVSRIVFLQVKKKSGKVNALSISDQLHIDLAPDGSVFGIELFNAKQQLGAGRSPTLHFLNQSSGHSTKLALGV